MMSNRLPRVFSKASRVAGATGLAWAAAGWKKQPTLMRLTRASPPAVVEVAEVPEGVDEPHALVPATTAAPVRPNRNCRRENVTGRGRGCPATRARHARC